MPRGNTNAATNLSTMFLLLPMIGMTTMADEGLQLGKERFAGELEMMARMDQENLLRGSESLVDYTRLGTMNPALYDERQH